MSIPATSRSGGVLDYPLHLAPYRFLQPLRPDVGPLPTAQAETLHPVAHVVAAGSGQVVEVLLAVANVGSSPGGLRVEVVAALAASQKVLQQVDHLRIPLGPPVPLLLQLLRPFPVLVVHQSRDRDLNPGLLRLVVDLHTILGGDVAGLSVDPGARVGGIPQNVFSVFQSTQNSTVLMDSQFGCDRDRIDSNRLRRLQTAHLWWIEEQVGRPPYAVKPSRVGLPKQR